MIKAENFKPTGGDFVHSLNNKAGANRLKIIGAVPLAIFFWWLFLIISSTVYMQVLKELGYQTEIAKFMSSFDITVLPNGDRAIDWVLFLLFPSVYLTNRILFKEKAGEMMSVTGRFRMKWALRCLLFMIPVMAVTVIGQNSIGGFPVLTLPKGALLAVLLSVFFTSIQCLGEEMLFRSWALQTFGVLFKNRKTAWIAVTFVSGAAFALVHDPGNAWVGLSLFCFGIFMCLLVYYTGGMEAAIIFHTLNNLILNLTELFTLEEQDFSAEQEIASNDWQGAVLSTVLEFVCFLALLWYWKRFMKKEESRAAEQPPANESTRAISS